MRQHPQQMQTHQENQEQTAGAVPKEVPRLVSLQVPVRLAVVVVVGKQILARLAVAVVVKMQVLARRNSRRLVDLGNQVRLALDHHLVHPAYFFVGNNRFHN